MLLDHKIDLPIITAERFILRPVQKSDAGLIGLYSADKRVATMTRSIPHPLPHGATEAFIARETAPIRGRDVWVMDGSARNHAEVMGVISLERMDRNQSEVRFWVAPIFWNEGIASEALHALIEANPHTARTMFAEVFQDNPGSARVLTNCGFDYLGDAEAHSVARGANLPTWTYTRKMVP